MLLFTGEGAAHSSKYQVVLLEERVRGVWGGPFPLDIITLRTGTVPLSWDSHCTLCHLCIVWVGHGCMVWGERQVWRVPWDPLSSWSRATVHPRLCRFVLGPMPLSHPSHSVPGLAIVLCRNGHP